MWGGISKNKLEPIFVAQKHCIRILFGDKKAYLDKFRTCARTRPYNAQRLGQDFYEREHTKPLFNKNQIMTVHNLYNYHILNSICTIIKLRVPISIYSCFTLSQRKETLFITPYPSEIFFYRASSLWNTFLSCPEGKIAKNLTAGFGSIKSKTKELIYRRQNMGIKDIWDPAKNFVLH